MYTLLDTYANYLHNVPKSFVTRTLLLLFYGFMNMYITNGLQILPTSERQVRPLVSLEPEQQRACWQEAVNVAGGKVPSGRFVKDIVDKIRERTKLPNPYHVGEVCQILPKDNPDLKGS